MKENRRDYEEKSVNNIIFYDNDRAGSAKLELPALAIYIRHDFGHVKSRRQKRPSFLSPQLFHHGLSVSHYLYSCLTSFSLD